MTREPIKDPNGHTLGYVETTPDGKQRALDANNRTLGHYDPERDVTQDTHYRIVARGNVLASFIYN